MIHTITRNTNTRRMESSQPHLHALYAAMPPYPPHAGGDDDRLYGERLIARACAEGFAGDVKRLINWALRDAATYAIPNLGKPDLAAVEVPHRAAYELRVPVRYIKAHLAIVAAAAQGEA